MYLITLLHIYTPNQACRNADGHQFIIFKNACYLKSPPRPPVQSSSPRVKVTVYLTRDVTSADEQFGKANTVKLCFSEYSVSEPESKKKKKKGGRNTQKHSQQTKLISEWFVWTLDNFLEAGCDKTNKWKRFIGKRFVTRKHIKTTAWKTNNYMNTVAFQKTSANQVHCISGKKHAGILHLKENVFTEFCLWNSADCVWVQAPVRHKV